MMNIEKIFSLRTRNIFILYVVLDFLCMGLGMGVPFFNILFGFIVGWFLIKWISIGTSEVREILKQLLLYSCIAAGVTFLGMLLLWGWSAKFLFTSETEIVNFGIPLILYEPRLSLIGWLFLMIVISPFLQLLTTIFGGHVTWLLLSRRNNN